ncbi:aminodeoxychorismate/anthranilate synthase component II [Parvibaculum sp.]|uniref:anthranilate synthase component II n=1 Tax=Parvibaculum sp. TaxID=2024848 RepID=UPI001B0ABB83|nr:aminodeoxychorismate/anthranilate synthase component II [Parvibaculum sp.]MBO6668682.1 aminodeoxychorismate/anthranilate synthase component II [Parvibaculum sp.]MBO6691240.1 aminodeoxychorismate/anthranilate synthase component II [Parvibaculum sp.]MBO6714359.1 aminodeoxychorismate/anthranilate synthase component II [Parvibaculum sp.]
MILVIDNFDSFVHNLARYVGELGHERRTIRTDEIAVDEALALGPEAIILSPGPCGPDKAGISIPLVKAAAEGGIPLLGVCLGHQAIASAFGGHIPRAPKPVHGKPSKILHDGKGIFEGIPSPFIAGRYHSLVAELDPEGPLHATAHTEDGVLMALEHESLPIHGVQFHPESVLTEHGHALLANFLRTAKARPVEERRSA